MINLTCTRPSRDIQQVRADTQAGQTEAEGKEAAPRGRDGKQNLAGLSSQLRWHGRLCRVCDKVMLYLLYCWS